ncbi:calcium release-activated calcium channel protein 1 isoform X2 [Dendroctonus ponderosae]|uniref:Calcium release-activated calcium channel protein 1 n=1 Tax=Dendroctonus ponderosae TaxID=77166 RepID=A0AAR5P1W7_DENPD|nr:calcium release-activated calcium channel protein 1 isoform X2 [Dendroctonus ponderosae]
MRVSSGWFLFKCVVLVSSFRTFVARCWQRRSGTGAHVSFIQASRRPPSKLDAQFPAPDRPPEHHETEAARSLIPNQSTAGRPSSRPSRASSGRPSTSAVPKFCELMYVWSTSAVGLDLSKAAQKGTAAENSQLYNRGHSKRKHMPMSEEMFHTPRYLSWRKMHLSRAKLKASSKTSALLSGFAMVAMVELQLNNESAIPSPILVIFAVITTLLVAVHMLALMISTCILPNIETVCSLDSISLVDESPHERLHWYIEIAWAFSTLLGLLLFLAEIAIICWLKFYNVNTTAAWSATVVLVPILFVFLAFAIHFYRSLVAHKYEISMKELKRMNDQIGDVTGNKLFSDEPPHHVQVV